jgi:hypothetical protein
VALARSERSTVSTGSRDDDVASDEAVFVPASAVADDAVSISSEVAALLVGELATAAIALMTASRSDALDDIVIRNHSVAATFGNLPKHKGIGR